MTAFQVLAIGASLSMAALSLAAAIRRGGGGAGRGLAAWAALWLLAAAALAVPDALTALAHRLGIGRGADVLLYVAVLAGIVVASRQSMALRRQERQVTLLVRELAILRAEVGPAAAAPEVRR